MPDLEVLENPKTSLASEVISSDGKTLGKYYFNDNRTPVTFDELPTHLVDALIATEDIRFYSHSGIDFKRTFGAALKLGKDGGGSTITQQLAKLLFTGEGSRDILERLTQKFKEYIIAVRLERHYTKDEIIKTLRKEKDSLKKENERLKKDSNGKVADRGGTGSKTIFLKIEI